MLIQWSCKIYFPCILFITYLKYAHPCHGFWDFLEPHPIQSHPKIHSNPTPKPVIQNHLPKVLQTANRVHLEKHTTPTTRRYNTIFTTPPNHRPKQTLPPHKTHATKHLTPTTRKSVHDANQAHSKTNPVVNKVAKNSTENLHLKNEKETIESGLLLSSQDSIENFPIINLKNTSSPANTSLPTLPPKDCVGHFPVPINNLKNTSSPADTQHSNNKTQGNSKNSFHFMKTVQKSVISNKVSTIYNHHNIETRIYYMKNPYIILGIVALAVIILAAVIAGIVVHCRKKN